MVTNDEMLVTQCLLQQEKEDEENFKNIKQEQIMERKI